MNTPLLIINPAAPEPERIVQAAEVLLAGQFVILPTDTVYGVGLLASDTASPDRLFEGKRRQRDKGIPLLVASADELARLGRDVPEHARKLASRHWPGALTLVVRASDEVPGEFVAADGSIALRMPANDIARALLKAVGMPVACSSANLSGLAPACSVQQLDPLLRAAAALVIDGGSLSGGVASTVVSCLEDEPRVLRPGPVAI
ncbi:MAG: threonylcarbamoyl-AMP synthase [Coriobacteriales bacterium]|nr:threonylcarbamoyl-AMP synthase [Coriobacteriales bacterium]